MPQARDLDPAQAASLPSTLSIGTWLNKSEVKVELDPRPFSSVPAARAEVASRFAAWKTPWTPDSRAFAIVRAGEGRYQVGQVKVVSPGGSFGLFGTHWYNGQVYELGNVQGVMNRLFRSLKVSDSRIVEIQGTKGRAEFRRVGSS